MKQSSQAKDILAIYRTYIEKALRRLKREIDNLVVIMTPWEMRIKKIESQVETKKKLRRSTYFVMHLIMIFTLFSLDLWSQATLRF